MSTETWFGIALIVFLYCGVSGAFYLIGRDATDAKGWRRIPAGFMYFVREQERRFVAWADEFANRNRKT